MFVVGAVPQIPARDDQAGGVRGQSAIAGYHVGSNACGQVSSNFSRLSGIFGQIACRRDVSQFSSKTDRPNVKLGAPDDGPAISIPGFWQRARLD